ncbi:hypothetical protein [Cytobacillus gottheilii]|nr:hypothetical protein [Cytobacillus gottheilii]
MNVVVLPTENGETLNSCSETIYDIIATVKKDGSLMNNAFMA